LSDRFRADRRYRTLLLVAAGLGVALALLLWLLAVHPINESAYNDGRARSLLYFVIFFWAAPAVVWIADRLVSRLRPLGAVTVALAVFPTTMLLLALHVREAHALQDRAVAVYRGYTRDISALHDVGFHERHGRYVTVCAVEGERPEYGNPAEFCLEINLRRPKGSQVEGGYRLRAEAGEFPAEPQDCFGDTVACSR
jgi:hypothetical protein